MTDEIRFTITGRKEPSIWAFANVLIGDPDRSIWVDVDNQYLRPSQTPLEILKELGSLQTEMSQIYAIALIVYEMVKDEESVAMTPAELQTCMQAIKFRALLQIMIRCGAVRVADNQEYDAWLSRDEEYIVSLLESKEAEYYQEDLVKEVTDEKWEKFKV